MYSVGPRGAARADGHVCVCHLRVRMSRRHALLPSPSTCILFSPQRKSGQAGRKSTGGSWQPRWGSGSRGRARHRTPAPRGRCDPGGCPPPVPLPLQSRSPQPGGTHHQMASHPGELRAGEHRGTSEGCGAREVTQAGEDPKSRHCPSQVDFPQPSTLPSTQLLSSQHCMAIKVINAGAVRLPAPCMATRICREEHCCDEGKDNRLIVMLSLRLGR